MAVFQTEDDDKRGTHSDKVGLGCCRQPCRALWDLERRNEVISVNLPSLSVFNQCKGFSVSFTNDSVCNVRTVHKVIQHALCKQLGILEMIR